MGRLSWTMDAMGDDVRRHVQLSAEQVVALRRELTMALDQLDALEHLCSVQVIANRLEEAISAALYVLERAESTPRDLPSSLA